MTSDETLRCDRCRSSRLASVTAKCSDLCAVYLPNSEHEHQGYVPGGMGIGSGDYVCFGWCLDCGKIQDEDDGEEKFPLSPCALEKAAEIP